MNITINELARQTGVSAYEIRRRVHNGTLPHMRVGAKQTKILINADVFKQLLTDESNSNMEVKHKQIVSVSNPADETGYGRLRRID
jgi:excisionase family DNA binding protein